MKAIKIGDNFSIYSDSIKTYDVLPPGTYTLNFSQMQGFFLTETHDIVLQEKTYGVHEEKVEKILSTFESEDFNRNLGIIFSGKSGIGKTLCAKMTIQRAIEHGYPCVIVNNYIPGIADYISKIDQRVVVLFDEFEKVFGTDYSDRNTQSDPQVEMLSLFDGADCGVKKMFIVTCNEISRLNDYLLNRPGRFHYHFRFNNPSPEDIHIYLTDKLKPEYVSEINNVINFSKKVDLNYDCLRAIAFELNQGRSFREAVVDLNIVNVDPVSYDVVLKLDNGKIFSDTLRLNLFNGERTTEWLWDETKSVAISITFAPSEAVMNMESNKLFIPLNKFSFEIDDDASNEIKKKYENVKAENLSLSRHISKDTLHYVL